MFSRDVETWRIAYFEHTELLLVLITFKHFLGGTSHKVNDIALCICSTSAAILLLMLDGVTEPPLFDMLNRLCFAWADLYPLQRKRIDYEQLNNTLAKESAIQFTLGEYLTNSIFQQLLGSNAMLKCCSGFLMCFKNC